MKTTFIQDQDLSASNMNQPCVVYCNGCRISDEDLSASQQDALMQCSYRMCRVSDEDLSASLPLPVPCNCRIDA